VDESVLLRCKATSDHSVSVYDRPVTEVTDWHNQIIGTVNAGPNGIEAHRPHDSLADRFSARLDGEFKTLGDGVLALIADHERRASHG
jgi:hypothetical protein